MGTGLAGSVFGKIRFIEKPGVQDEGEGGRHVAKRSSDPRVAYPEIYHTYPSHAKGALCGPVGTHRAPIGSLCEGSSMRLYKALTFLNLQIQTAQELKAA